MRWLDESRNHHCELKERLSAGFVHDQQWCILGDKLFALEVLYEQI